MRKIAMLFPAVFILMGLLSFRSSREVTGKVTDEKGLALQAAVITVKGTTKGTVTGSDGSYRIHVPEGYKILVFSCAGFQTMEISIGDTRVVNASLRVHEALSEVILTVPYSLSRSLSGSVAGIQASGRSPGRKKRRNFNTEEYGRINENRFFKTSDEPQSTFSIDVDAASYSNVRRFLNEGALPPPDAVRIEEMVNYFKYDYARPSKGDPFAIHTEMTDCPWNSDHKIVMIGLQGRQIPKEELPPSNLVFLIDVSGSMSSENKLPLVKSSLKLLVEQMREQDKISIVVYAGAAGLALPPTSGADKRKINDAIEGLESGGSTAGGDGIQLAYKVARENFMESGNNRIILATDGDFNIGVSSTGDLERLIEKERESGVFLTVLGYGMGNYKDNRMQELAGKGNGNHAYIDTDLEAKKVLVSEFGGTLFTIAKDVKLQVEFNPSVVQGYRLIGYENRLLENEDFNDDKKDAGELGSGHTVTAVYEVIPIGVKSGFLKGVDSLKYQSGQVGRSSGTEEILTVKFRYKNPGGFKSRLIEKVVLNQSIDFENASENLRFASAVIEFGMLLRNSEFKSGSSFEQVISIASKARSFDAEGYRKEFINLVEKAAQLKKKDADVSKN